MPWLLLLFFACAEGSTARQCQDEADDDGDDLVDCQDPGCSWTEHCASTATLFINEFMAENTSTVADENGTYSDWIELYNPNTAPVLLEGWTMTDFVAEPDAHEFGAELEVPAQGYLLLWADGEPEVGPTHLDFKLGAGGEHIGIYDPWGRGVDVLVFQDQLPDISAARVGDGGERWAQEPDPTPGQSNR